MLLAHNRVLPQRPRRLIPNTDEENRGRTERTPMTALAGDVGPTKLQKRFEHGRKIIALQIGETEQPLDVQFANRNGAKCSARHARMNRAAWKNRYTEAKLNHLDDCLGAL